MSDANQGFDVLLRARAPEPRRVRGPLARTVRLVRPGARGPVRDRGPPRARRDEPRLPRPRPRAAAPRRGEDPPTGIAGHGGGEPRLDPTPRASFHPPRGELGACRGWRPLPGIAAPPGPSVEIPPGQRQCPAGAA